MQGGSIFLLAGFFGPGFNSSNMVLIPKMRSAFDIGHHRPFVLNNFMFKVITKILANRLASTASRVIS